MRFLGYSQYDYDVKLEPNSCRLSWYLLGAFLFSFKTEKNSAEFHLKIYPIGAKRLEFQKYEKCVTSLFWFCLSWGIDTSPRNMRIELSSVFVSVCLRVCLRVCVHACEVCALMLVRCACVCERERGRGRAFICWSNMCKKQGMGSTALRTFQVSNGGDLKTRLSGAGF